MSVWELYTQLFARNWRCGRFAQSLSQGYWEKIRKKDVVMTAGRWSSWIYCYPETKRQSSQWKHAGSPRPKKAGQNKSTHKFLTISFFDSTGMIYMHWVPTGQTVKKEYSVEVLREFRKRFLGKRLALFKSGQWHFHQDNAPVHNSILVTDYLTKMASRQFLILPIVQTLLPVTFGYSLSSRKNLEAFVMRQLKRWKSLWRRSLTCSHKRTSLEPSRSCWNGTSALQLEVITSKGTVCTINKNAHTEKSLETYWRHLILFKDFFFKSTGENKKNL